MGSCKTIRVFKKKLCASDLRHLVQLMTRSQSAGNLESVEPVEIFTESAKIYMAIKTVKGGSFVSEIQTLSETTHLFLCRYSPVLGTVDITAHFLKFNFRYYHILKISKINEDNLSVAIECTVRGDVLKEASHA